MELGKIARRPIAWSLQGMWTPERVRGLEMRVWAWQPKAEIRIWSKATATCCSEQERRLGNGGPVSGLAELVSGAVIQWEGTRDLFSLGAPWHLF